MIETTVVGPAIGHEGGITAIRGIGENITPSILNKMWLQWDGRTDVKLFYGKENIGEHVGQQSPLSNFHKAKHPFRVIAPSEINGFPETSPF